MSPRKLRVMEVIGSLHIGGAERVVESLARGLDPARFEVAVRCTRALGVIGEGLAADGVDVRLVAPRRQFRHFTSLALRQEIAAWRPDIVHTHGVPAMIHTGPLAPFGLVPPWIHTFHYGNYSSKLTMAMRAERVLSRGAARLIAVSDAQREALIEVYGVPPDRITTIVNGVNENPHVDDAAFRARKRAELGLDASDIAVGCVAVLTEQKGITYLLEAASRLLQAHSQVRVIVVGGGPLEQPLREQAAAIDRERIVFTGWRKDGAQLLHALDVFVMSSLWEAMPIVLLESMSARRPIVVTDVGENRRIVDEGRCGVVIPPRNPDAIAAAVERLISNPQDAAAMASRAYDRFRGAYTTPHMVRSYEALFGRSVRTGGIPAGRRQPAPHSL